MAKELMSDAEMRRRQKLQGKIGRTTSTLGLAGVGLAGAGALAAHKPGLLRKIPKLKEASPEKLHQTGEKLKNAAFYTGITSGGIGGVGGFNQASIYSAESRKRKQTVPVKKELGMDMGYFGDEGIAKAWSPEASKFDSEASREKRNKHYQTATVAAGGAAGAFGASEGIKAVKALRKPETTRTLENTARALHHGGRAAGGLAAVGAAAGAHHALKRKREGSWKPYAKRDTTSAFGIEHEEINKAFKLPGAKGLKKAGAGLKRLEPGSSNPKSVLASEKFSDPFGGKGKQPGHHLTERW